MAIVGRFGPYGIQRSRTALESLMGSKEPRSSPPFCFLPDTALIGSWVRSRIAGTQTNPYMLINSTWLFSLIIGWQEGKKNLSDLFFSYFFPPAEFLVARFLNWELAVSCCSLGTSLVMHGEPLLPVQLCSGVREGWATLHNRETFSHKLMSYLFGFLINELLWC